MREHRSTTAEPGKVKPLDAARTARRADVELPADPILLRRALAVPRSLRRGYIKCVTGKAGLRARIRAKCMDCSAWQRAEVAACSVTGCPLWAIRMGRQRETLYESDRNGAELPGDAPC